MVSNIKYYTCESKDFHKQAGKFGIPSTTWTNTYQSLMVYDNLYHYDRWNNKQECIKHFHKSLHRFKKYIDSRHKKASSD